MGLPRVSQFIQLSVDFPALVAKLIEFKQQREMHSQNDKRGNQQKLVNADCHVQQWKFRA